MRFAGKGDEKMKMRLLCLCLWITICLFETVRAGNHECLADIVAGTWVSDTNMTAEGPVWFLCSFTTQRAYKAAFYNIPSNSVTTTVHSGTKSFSTYPTWYFVDESNRNVSIERKGQVDVFSYTNGVLQWTWHAWSETNHTATIYKSTFRKTSGEW
jgi:hypothetical protein